MGKFDVVDFVIVRVVVWDMVLSWWLWCIYEGSVKGFVLIVMLFDDFVMVFNVKMWVVQFFDYIVEKICCKYGEVKVDEFVCVVDIVEMGVVVYEVFLIGM